MTIIIIIIFKRTRIRLNISSGQSFRAKFFIIVQHVQFHTLLKPNNDNDNNLIRIKDKFSARSKKNLSLFFFFWGGGGVLIKFF